MSHQPPRCLPKGCAVPPAASSSLPYPWSPNPQSLPKPHAGKALSMRPLSLDAARAVGWALGQENELLVWWDRPGSIPGRKWGQGISSRVPLAAGNVPGVNQLLRWELLASTSREGVQVPESHLERQRCISLKACPWTCWLLPGLGIKQPGFPVFQKIAEIFWHILVTCLCN